VLARGKVSSLNILLYTLRRLGTGVLVLFGVSLITFVLAHSVSSNPLVAWFGRGIEENPGLAQHYAQIYHLNDPLYIQYFYYINGLLHLQLGWAPSADQPLTTIISQTLPWTIQLLVLSLIFTTAIGIGSGILSARFAGRFPDKILRGLYLTGMASPAFFIAIALAVVFSGIFRIFPTTGGYNVLTYVPPPAVTHIPMLDALLAGQWSTLGMLLWYAILPALAISLGVYGILTRVLRSNMIDLMSSNFIRAARARAVPENRIFLRHAFKNSLVSVITLVAIIVNISLVADLFAEEIFAYPGLGKFAVDSALAVDYPSILATTLIFATIIVVVNLIADILYAVVDPRIRYS
jgi:peptide/nickel transport system permease protein